MAAGAIATMAGATVITVTTTTIAATATTTTDAPDAYPAIRSKIAGMSAGATASIR
jgi:hypothetical protein